MNNASGGRPVLNAAAMLALLATAAAAHADHTLILHVDDDAAAGGDGLSWGAPFQDLQDALDAARQAAMTDQALKRIEVLVAQGTYTPGMNGRFELSFMAEEVPAVGEAAILGGYAGLSGAEPGLRDPAIFRTILSGDRNGDDDAGLVNRSDNSAGVLRAGTLNSAMVMIFDGLTIRGGHAYSGGGGLGVFQGIGRIRNCVIEENYCRYSGGGIFAQDAAVQIESTIVRNNRTDEHGGGVCIVDSYWPTGAFLEATGCVIDGNEAVFGGGIYADALVSVERTDVGDNVAVAGGGVYVDSSEHGWPRESVIGRSRIAGNRVWSNGAGIYTKAPLACHSTLIANNRATDLGGGLYAALGAEPAIYSSTIVENMVRRGAGVMLDELQARAIVSGSIIWGNWYPFSSEQVLLRSIAAADAPVFTHGILQGGAAEIARVEAPLPDLTGSIDADPQFRNPEGADGHDDSWRDNDWSLLPTSPAIDAGSDPFKRTLDLRGNARAVDVPAAANRVDPEWPIDMGAIEFAPCPCDPDGDEATTAFDLLLYLDWWFAGEALAERTGDGPARVDVFDLLAFLDCWFAAGAGWSCP